MSIRESHDAVPGPSRGRRLERKLLVLVLLALAVVEAIAIGAVVLKVLG